MDSEPNTSRTADIKKDTGQKIGKMIEEKTRDKIEELKK